MSLIAFGCTSTAALLGIVLHRVLPEEHLADAPKDVVRLVMGLIATITALVLGLLIASASNNFSAQQAELQKLAVGAVQLGRVLNRYGPEADSTRAALLAAATALRDHLWDPSRTETPNLDTSDIEAPAERLFTALSALSPQSDVQQFTKSQALQLGVRLGETRASISINSAASVSWPLLIVLIAWMSVLFLGFALFAPVQPTMLVALLIGAASVAVAIFLILELNRPYTGVIRLSDEPIRHAVELLAGSATR